MPSVSEYYQFNWGQVNDQFGHSGTMHQTIDQFGQSGPSSLPLYQQFNQVISRGTIGTQVSPGFKKMSVVLFSGI